jgi:hypothetical protein
MGKAKAQIYLGNEALFEKHKAPTKDLKEISLAQLRAAKPVAAAYICKKREESDNRGVQSWVPA